MNCADVLSSDYLDVFLFAVKLFLSRFECQVSAEPLPDIIWLYNGQPLTSTQRITLTYDKTVTTLTISNATLEDTGEYTCQATNALGEAITKTLLRVRSM